MVDTLLFGTALLAAQFAAIAMAHGQPAPPHPLTGPDVLPPNTTDLDN
jgi:hypothetical protein